MATGDGVLEVDGIVEFALQVPAELVHMKIVLVLAKGVLDLATDGLHTKERERDQAHQGDSQPAQDFKEGEGQG